MLFGHDLRNEPDGRIGGFRRVNPPIHVALHGRRPEAPRDRPRQPHPAQLRRRGSGRPATCRSTRMVDQIPLPPLPAGREVLVVIAPLQVIGPPVLDELVAPLSYRIFDLAIARASSTTTSDLAAQPDRPAPDARHQPRRDRDVGVRRGRRSSTCSSGSSRTEQVVLLSGDVHNSSGTAMSYWRGHGDPAGPLRPVHLERVQERDAAMITAVDRGRRVRPAAGPGQPRHRAHRLGPARRTTWCCCRRARRSADLVPAMRSRLVTTPGDDPDLGLAGRQRRCRPPTRVRPTKASRLNPARAARLALAGRRRCSTTGPTPSGRSRSGRSSSTTTRSTATSPATRRCSTPTRRSPPATSTPSATCATPARSCSAATSASCRFNERPAARSRRCTRCTRPSADPDQPAAAEPKPEPYMVQEASLGPASTRSRRRACARPRSRSRRPDPGGARWLSQTFLQKLVGEVVSTCSSFVGDVLGRGVGPRGASITDLGGNADRWPPARRVPDGPLESIKAYRDAANPDAEADAAVVADVLQIARRPRQQRRGVGRRTATRSPASTSSCSRCST